jgi:hypothetical protein
MFYSARLGTKKPDQEFLAKVQAAVGLCGEEMLLIDDSRQNIKAALEAGWQMFHWISIVPPTSCAACVRDLPLKGIVKATRTGIAASRGRCASVRGLPAGIAVLGVTQLSHLALSHVGNQMRDAKLLKRSPVWK